MIILNWEVRVIIVCYPGSTVTTHSLVSQFLAATCTCSLWFYHLLFSLSLFFFLISFIKTQFCSFKMSFLSTFFFLKISLKNLSAKFPLSIHSSCNGTFFFCQVHFLKGSAEPCSSAEILVQTYFVLVNGEFRRKDI